MKLLLLLTALAAVTPGQQYTRGVGIYPGDPREDSSPSMQIDATTYRNLALHRPAYQSSSYDYNLTAQLITDGIRETQLPRWLVVSTSEQGVLPKNQRELMLDGDWVTGVELHGGTGWVQLEIAGRAPPPEIDHINVDASVKAATPDNQEWTAVVSGSNDGQSWTELGRTWGLARPAGELQPSIAFHQPARSAFYRVTFESGRPLTWHIGELSFFDAGRPVHIGGPYDFTSAWHSDGGGEQWLYVDLGARCTFDRVTLHWLHRAAAAAIQSSDDAVSWHTLQPLPAASGTADDIRLPQTARARYVRLLMTRSDFPDGYILSEFEVYGRGGPVPQPKPTATNWNNTQLTLAGGRWRLQRESLVNGDGRTISQIGFNDNDWIIATVPGTVLSSYWNIGAVADPNFGDNQLLVSDSFFYADFWYRNEFLCPTVAPGRHVWLNFDGINWKAEIFLNGEDIGHIDAAFTRGHFDVTNLLHSGRQNALAVRIEKNATPGSAKQKTFQSPGANGGALGADNPTYHASIGWDWIPTIRGRDAGICGNVFLTSTGPVTIEDPFVRTSLTPSDTSRADIAIQVTLQNHGAQPVSGTLRGRFGDVTFEQPLALTGATSRTVTLDSSNIPALRLANPKLWWPNGYGDPNLYNVELRFETNAGDVSDSKTFQTGIRQFTYSEDGGTLRIWINGKRFIARGGNWGFGESMLRYGAREYDAAVRYHRDMHFTMIRNWVGQVGDDAFYRACDRYGIVVWQDFWLANPWDGPDPDNDAMFLRTADDFVRRIRNHPSIGLYCGRNEGFPPDPLQRGFMSILARLHPGIQYIPSSADNVVSGHGPYEVMPPKYYFAERATAKLHSELGMPNIVTMDSLRAMMPESAMWPQGLMWGMHDFCLQGAQGGAGFRGRIEQSYGGADNLAQWMELAQFVDYEGYRAMFEAQSRNRMGLLIWMSHPAWPSLVWQTYDYYFDPTAGYFGAKKASEPLHIQWNPLAETVEVVNYSAGNVRGLTARAQIFNMDGALKWDKTVSLDSTEDTTLSPITIEYPSGLTPVHFLRLELTRGGETLSSNFYWRGLEEDNYRALRNLPNARVEQTTHIERVGDRWRLTTRLRNASARIPAIMIHLKAVRQASGDRILPALYSDNYISLMPGETRTIITELADADTRGEKPRIMIDAFNLSAATPASAP